MTREEKVLQLKQDFDEVYEAGKQAEYDAFWDTYQQNGEKGDYAYSFAGHGWTYDNFKPKYDISPTNLNTCFHGFFSGVSGSAKYVDFVDLLEKCGVTLDTSRCTNFASTFMSSYITRLGVIDLRSATRSISGTFYASFLVTIEKIIISENIAFTNNAFQNAGSLENLTFEGVIGQSGLNLQWSTKLSRASIENVIGCLSSTTSGLTVTLSREAVDYAFESEEDRGDGSWSSEWSALVDTKPNWTISLV